MWFATLDPNGTIVRYQYGVDGALVKSSAGHYYIDIAFDTAGPWTIRWYSTGNFEAAQDGTVIVSASALQ